MNNAGDPLYGRTHGMKMTAVLGAGALLAAGVMTAAPAQAAPVFGGGHGVTVASCTHPSFSNRDSGSGTPHLGPAPLRTGPSESCNAINSIGVGMVVQYDCWVSNEGTTWTHVVIGAYKGWIWDYDLDDHGATIHC